MLNNWETERDALITSLGLQPHVEGGYFRRTYSSAPSVERSPGGRRPAVTSIYYLLTKDSPRGYLHRNHSDILHFWHAGEAIDVVTIDPVGRLANYRLGPRVLDGELPQLLVPGGYWKSSFLSKGNYGLISEAVCPGFLYGEMELADPKILCGKYPSYAQQIREMCRPTATHP